MTTIAKLKEQPFQMNRTKVALVVLLLLATCLAILWADSPVYQPIPQRDPGAFLYIGQQLLHGQRLYADLFDDKPPMIFWTNALGLWLSAGSTWGVWALEVLSLCAAVLFAFFLLAGASGYLPALLALAAFTGNYLRFLLGGNFTEEFALPFQFLILVSVLPASLEKRLTWRAFLAGAAWGVVFFYKQNLFGIGLAAGAYLLLSGVMYWKRGRLWDVLWYAGGFLAVAALVGGFFLVQGTLWEFWDATFLSNFAYITLRDKSRADAIVQTINGLLTHGVFLAGTFIAWLASLQGLILVICTRIRDWPRWPAWITASRRTLFFLAGGGLLILLSLAADLIQGRMAVQFGLVQWMGIILGIELILLGLAQQKTRLERWIRDRAGSLLTRREAVLLALAGLAYPLDIISMSLSGKSFTHYYLIILPSATILSGILVSGFLRLMRTRAARAAAWIAILAAFTPTAFIPLVSTFQNYHVRQDAQIQIVSDYVVSHTQPDDQVLVWGGEPVINFVSGRTRPNRFVFMSQLFLPGYASDALAAEMLRDLKANPPQLIVYTKQCLVPFMDYQENACVPVLPSWDAVFDFVKQNYQPVVDLGPEHWDVYQKKN